MALPELAAKPQLVALCKQTVPLSFGKLIVRLAVGAVNPSVVVNDPLVALTVILELPTNDVACVVSPSVKLPNGAVSVPSKPLYVAWIAPIVTVPVVVLTLKI